MEDPLPTQLAPGPAEPPRSDWSRVPSPAPTPTAGFGVGVFLSATFRAWLGGLPAFGILGVATAAPLAFGVYRLYTDLPALAHPDPDLPFEQLNAFFGTFARWWVIAIVVMGFEMAAVAYGALARLRGEKVGFGGMLAAGFRRGPSVLGVLVLFLLASAGTVCVVVVPVILGCGWAASVPTAVLERAGPIRALTRSWHLTSGHRGPIFVGFLVLMVAATAASMLIQSVTVNLFAAFGGVDVATPGPALALPMAIAQLAAGVLNTLSIVGCAAAYHRLCLVKEGGDPVHLANVFE